MIKKIWTWLTGLTGKKPAPKVTLKKVWRDPVSEGAKARAAARQAELTAHVASAIQAWPGAISMHHDSRKLKAVIDDNGTGLVVQVWIEVTPGDLANVAKQAARRSSAAAELRARADALEQPPEVTGKLDMTVTPEQLIKLLGGKRT